ncbi:hypothetical protein CEXT_420921 [Caerostris extrusa]|uniref:Uncharacterized protein n=1 Tax=Caerostris extrusa TaxID=172846 RepID=A0AAV4M9D5_CAEEX|nr:hypothetical protein CEXT_420921 [Caerostris extrusa]
MIAWHNRKPRILHCVFLEMIFYPIKHDHTTARQRQVLDEELSEAIIAQKSRTGAISCAAQKKTEPNNLDECCNE